MRRFIVAVVLAAAAVVSGHALVAADGPNRAGIVVSFGDGRSESLCVEFTETEISGAELLKRAGFTVVAAGGGMGAAMCMIDGVGCADPSDCWCQCHGAGCRYWAYYTLGDGGWRYSAIGSSLRKVRNGDVDGWAWGTGSAGSGAKPELRTFEQICPPPASPTSTPSPAPTPLSTTPPVATSEVAGATAAAPTATVAEQTPPATATTPKPTGLPISRLPTEVAGTTKDAGGSGIPWQLPAFAVLAVGLLGTAVVLGKRRSGG